MTAPSARIAWRAGEPGRPVEADLPPALLPYARAFFPDDQVEPPGGPPELLVRETRAGRFLVRTPRGEFGEAAPPELLARFELELAELLLARSGGVHVIHGGGVRIGGGAVVLSGPSGAGKSTLTAALAMRGALVYGDDVLLLETEGGRIRPFRRLLKLDHEARRVLGLPAAEGPLAELWPEVSFYRPADLGSGWAEPAPVRWVVFPRRSRESVNASRPQVALSRVSGAETIRRLLFELLLVAEPEGPHFRALAGALEHASFHELSFGSAPQAAERLLRSLRQRAG